MKKLFLILIVNFLVNSSMAQWMFLNSGTTKHLHSVCFTDVNTGYAVGDSGIVLKTIDGGSDWTIQSSGTSKNLYSVSFANADTGFIAGENDPQCLVLKTTNGGNSWNRLTVQAVGCTLYSISCYDADTVYAVGAQRFLLKTDDGGVQWYILMALLSDTYYSVRVTDAWTAYYVGKNGVIMKTSQILPSGTSNDLYSVHFPDMANGFVVGDKGIILKTTNSGTNWSSQLSPVTVPLRSVYFLDSQTGYIVADSGIILKTGNGGTTWVIQNSNTINNLQAVYFPAHDTGYAVGENGTILKTNNGGGFPLSIQNQSETPRLLKIYPNPASDKINIEFSDIQSYVTLSVYKPDGTECMNLPLMGLSTQIEIKNLPSGVYFIKLMGEHNVLIGKFIKM
jgi:photosystem II stability/assembly factor-like uncharacterized protein